MKKFSFCHPAVNFVYYISAVIFGVIFRHPVLLCISFFSLTAYYIKCDGKNALKSIFLFYCPLILFVTLINGLTAHYGVTTLFRLPNGNNVCLEPIVYGFVTGVSAVGVILVFACYNKTVTSDKLIFILGKKMPKTAMLLNLSLRFVPLYRQKLHEISEAQTGLGLGINSPKIISRIKNAGRITGILISWALENSVITADSMKSRGYALKNRTSYNDFHFSRFDFILLILFFVSDAIITAGIFFGASYVMYNPFFKINKISAMSVIMYLFYAFLLLIPFAVDCAEDLKWKKLKSRI